VTRAATPKLGAYAGLAALGLLAALATRRPELVVLAAPFALSAALGLVLARRPQLDARVDLASDRALEGEEVEVRVLLEAAVGAERVEVLLELPRDLVVEAGDNPILVHLRDGERRELTFGVRCARWGGFRVGRLFVRTADAFGVFRHETVVDRRTPLKVYPSEETVRTLLRPLETQVFSGNHVARQKGEGIEFADLRPFVPGDRVRRVNWRASARRGELWVNERHPERNADVVVFLDTFGEASRGGDGTLDLAVRAAAAIVDRYFRRRDRIGLVGFGGSLRWLFPASGIVQLYRIVDALIDTEIVLSYTWRGVDVIPQRTLTPKALVIALTPLLDERAVSALLDLRARGFDLVVVDVSPVGFVDPGRDAREQLGHRLWLLRRDALRAQYERVGVPVVEWRQGSSLEQALEEVAGFRRHAGSARA